MHGNQWRVAFVVGMVCCVMSRCSTGIMGMGIGIIGMGEWRSGSVTRSIPQRCCVRGSVINSDITHINGGFRGGYIITIMTTINIIMAG